MAEPSLKSPPWLKLAPDAPAIAERARSFARMPRQRLRKILLIAVPVLAAVIGLGVYLTGGRYVTTDNAYVGAQKVLITPDISGKIEHVSVREGQHIKAGEELFTIDREPFQLAVNQAAAKVAGVRSEFAALKSNLQAYTQLSDLAQKNVELKQRDVERKQKLVETRAVSPADLDTAISGAVTAQLQAKLAEQQKLNALNQLLGNPDLPIEKYPAYMQAQAALDQARRDLDHTTLRAPIDGTATQVDNIQLGRFVTAGTPVFAVVDDAAPWVDANPKETDITYLHVGQKATVDVDTFPNHTFRGTVIAVSPGTGAQFAILPPQNASGNWVKVVQRIGVRVQLDRDPAASNLRAGMSATVEIDTGHRRSLATLFGFSSEAKEVTEK